jgi:hypothetical protein
LFYVSFGAFKPFFTHFDTSLFTVHPATTTIY